MRVPLLMAIALALSACGERRVEAEGCTLAATRTATWSNVEAPDIVNAAAEGERCADAAVRLTIRSAAGDLLWDMDSTYYEMAVGGAAPQNAPAIDREAVQTFLSSWADVTTLRARELPAWREGADAPGDGSLHTSPMERAAYEALRAGEATAMCAAVSVARSECFVLDAASREPRLVLASGA